VLTALLASPARTFAAEHSVYWHLLWTMANTTTRDAIRGLVARGQLEFAGGGWVQTDEAITWVGDTIDQFTLGHLWIGSALNATARTAWQADPFGHSATHAGLYAAMAMDAFVFGRPATSGELHP
jgi:hypothetical protein